MVWEPIKRVKPWYVQPLRDHSDKSPDNGVKISVQYPLPTPEQFSEMERLKGELATAEAKETEISKTISDAYRKLDETQKRHSDLELQLKTIVDSLQVDTASDRSNRMADDFYFMLHNPGSRKHLRELMHAWVASFEQFSPDEREVAKKAMDLCSADAYERAKEEAAKEDADYLAEEARIEAKRKERRERERG